MPVFLEIEPNVLSCRALYAYVRFFQHIGAVQQEQKWFGRFAKLLRISGNLTPFDYRNKLSFDKLKLLALTYRFTSEASEIIDLFPIFGNRPRLLGHPTICNLSNWWTVS